MDEDNELESAMLNIPPPPPKLREKSPPPSSSSSSSSAAELRQSTETGKGFYTLSSALEHSYSEFHNQVPSAALSIPPADTKKEPVDDLPALKSPVPLLKQLMFLVPEQSRSTRTERTVSTTDVFYVMFIKFT
ncbi:hypothetical protein PHYPO_G00204000 [Pangasianodon hypophthalmus]|uniref:Uncharacterized protein n=1 Tax=Pangasianodon hypophthalmus TaxID=310915 RepID=A0A5N5PBG8_PANHP|nr:hypothetical protein PHYPO_G00204000 [Pangasianodon hypophthalmus]